MATEPTATDAATDNTAARKALAAQMRRGMHLLVGHDLSSDELARMTAALEQQFDQLAAGENRARGSAVDWKGPSAVEVPDDGQAFPDSLDRPVSGQGNPFSVPLTMFRDGDAVISTVVLDGAFEGAPGRSHGGFVSAIFDDLFGSLPMLHRTIAFTASLTVNYVAASPIRVPVAYRVWIDRIEGKKIHMLGEARDGDTVVSTASALFIDASDFIAATYGPPPE